MISTFVAYTFILTINSGSFRLSGDSSFIVLLIILTDYHLRYDKIDLEPYHELVHKMFLELDNPQLPDYDAISMNTMGRRDTLRYLECIGELFYNAFYFPMIIYLLQLV